MSLAEVAITLNVQNNVSYPVQINVLGSPYNPLDTANAKTQFQYNVTGFTFTNESYVVIQYKANGSSSFSTFTQQLQAQSIQGVISALNLLNIGYFQTYTQSGQTYISTYNDNFTFGQLNIYAPSIINPTFFYGSGFNAPVDVILTQADGKIVCCGSFTSYNGTPINGYIVRLNTDGSIDTSFITGTGFDLPPNSIDQQSNGKLVFSGPFTTYDVNSQSNLTRLNTNGSFDGTFLCGVTSGLAPNKIKVQPDQKIVVAGPFNMVVNGVPASLIRLDSLGNVDGTFTGGVVSGLSLVPQINSLIIQADGKFVIIGDFDSYGGSGLVGYGIIRVNSNGTYDATLSTGTGFNSIASTIDIQSDQKLLIGGFFTLYNGNACSYAIRLNPNGSVDSVFTGTSFNSSVNFILYLTSGKILLGGQFNTYNGIPADGIIRLNSNTTIDTTWNYGSGFDGTGYGFITANSSQNLYNVAYSFSSFNLTPANNIIQLLG